MIRVLLVVLLACNPAFSQAVSPQLFSGLKWRLIGPFRGGRTVAVSGVAGDVYKQLASKNFFRVTTPLTPAAILPSQICCSR